MAHTGDSSVEEGGFSAVGKIDELIDDAEIAWKYHARDGAYGIYADYLDNPQLP
jgi:hypothetical protein